MSPVFAFVLAGASASRAKFGDAKVVLVNQSGTPSICSVAQSRRAGLHLPSDRVLSRQFASFNGFNRSNKLAFRATQKNVQRVFETIRMNAAPAPEEKTALLEKDYQLSVSTAPGSGVGTAVPSQQIIIPDMSLRTPPEMYQVALNAAIEKTKKPWQKTAVLGFMAGTYIGLAGMLYTMLGGLVPGVAASNPGLQKIITAIFFPVGLLMVTVNQAEMYTSNTLYLPLALYAKKANLGDVAKNWGISWFFNLLGGLFVATLGFHAGLFDYEGVKAFAQYVSQAKTHLSTPQMFFRAIIANWLVCIATWLQLGAKDPIGKMLYIWFPIFSFVAMGVEHSVANMFLIPAGILAGSGVAISELARNLFVVSLGNAVGGAVMVAGFAHFLYGKYVQKDAAK
mmetsp:Transcript_4355/g.6722  ORF Transcript_4355/g.6722 Transcript_4355/m.6722 type:complete len:396 (-) Transcript_4355:281-1468(-)|eukprot:CAMPEP_0184644212 /NCGR_PEP_ID=MMETSP0308-20130426/976_1 /TAXON_ID=38269 /ORGANISM="Gloeochaete witrockiana, Strain SAG 46.84" /LENGTH=395 /DNA_ID=CAMNT_0027072631 /DNA_START=165 /DNA_END=1352 /DNA_ORIENTATION=+